MRLFLLLAACVVALIVPAVAQAAPTASYTTSPAGPPWYTGEALTFNASGSTCDVAPCTYTWTDDGPDGPGGTNWPLGSGVTHTRTFANTGTKWVRLTVRNASGQTATTVRTHVISRGPRPTPPPPVACNDGVDNDGDGATDFPADPGCASATDTDEANVVTPPPSGSWPTPSTTGTPAGWTPTTTRSTELVVTTPGTVVQDVRFTNGAQLTIRAANVIVRRVEMQGGRIYMGEGNLNTLIEDTTVGPRAGTTRTADREAPIGNSGYTARRVEIYGRSEGFRAGGTGQVTIEDTWAQVNGPPSGTTVCSDWHGDGIQGYGHQNLLTVRNTFLELLEDNCGGGTAPFFYPHSQGNTRVDINRLIVRGGGYSFRNGMPGSVTQLKIVNNEWGYGPIDVRCSVMAPWEAQRVTLDANYQPTDVAAQPCNTNSGG